MNKYKKLVFLSGLILVLAGVSYAPAFAAFTQEQKITASDGVPGDNFGAAVSITADGTRMVAGAASKSSYTGAVYVYSRVSTSTTWTQEAKILAPDGANFDGFGTSVAISGDGTRLIVGSYRNGAISAQGAAYVYRRAGTVWTFEQKLTGVGPQAYDQFGISVAMTATGDRVAVSSELQDVGGYQDKGSVYIFSRTGTVWSLEQQITSSNNYISQFGTSLSLTDDGSRLLAGAPFTNTNGSIGSAYVFIRSGTTWSEEQILTTSDGVAGDWFGYKAQISGDGTRFIASSINSKIGANVGQGSAYIFSRSTSTNIWSQEKKIVASDGGVNKKFGEAVSIDSNGTRVLVGSRYKNEAYVSARTSSTVWTEEQILAPLDANGAPGFGAGVAMNTDGTRTVVGSENAIGAGWGQGATYVFMNTVIIPPSAPIEIGSTLANAPVMINMAGMTTSSYMITLADRPTSNVTVTITSNNAGIKVTQAINFTPNNWMGLKQVGIQVPRRMIVNPTVTPIIISSVASSNDPVYSGIGIPDVIINLTP